jgi:hypothetical protein
MGQERLDAYFNGTLTVRPLGKPVHQPSGKEKVAQIPKEWQIPTQQQLLEKKGNYE